MVISWFSAGVSSAVATKMANPDRIIYINIEDQHPDTYRFLKDCEVWFGKKIEVLESPYRNVENACLAFGYLKGPHGAKCTDVLKRRVRKEWEKENIPTGRHVYVWGMDKSEEKRAYGYYGLVNNMPDQDHYFPLINAGLSKKEVHGMLEAAGIKRPAMYDMGYNNNNCLGCIKGGMGYFNAIRRDFPDIFKKRAELERKIGHYICSKEKKVDGIKVKIPVYLDTLKPEDGNDLDMIIPDCGIFCEIEEAHPAQENGLKKDIVDSLQTATNT